MAWLVADMLCTRCGIDRAFCDLCPWCRIYIRQQQQRELGKLLNQMANAKYQPPKYQARV